MAFKAYNKSLQANKINESFDFYDIAADEKDNDFFEADSNIDYSMIIHLLDLKVRELTQKYAKKEYFEQVTDYENNLPCVYVQLSSDHLKVTNSGIAMHLNYTWDNTMYLNFKNCKASVLTEFIGFIKEELIQNNIKLDNKNYKIQVKLLNVLNDFGNEIVIDVSPLVKIFTNQENVFFYGINASAQSSSDITFSLKDINCNYIEFCCGEYDYEKTHFDFDNITITGGQHWKYGHNTIGIYPDKFFADFIKGNPFNGSKLQLVVTEYYNRKGKCCYADNLLKLLRDDLPAYGSSIFNNTKRLEIHTYAKSATDMMRICSSIIHALKTNKVLSLEDKNRYAALFLNNMYDKKQNRMLAEFYQNNVNNYVKRIPTIEKFPIEETSRVNESFDFGEVPQETEETYFTADTDVKFTRESMERFHKMINDFANSEYGKALGLNLNYADFQFDTKVITIFEKNSHWTPSRVITVHEDFNKSVEAIKILKDKIHELGYHDKIYISGRETAGGAFVEIESPLLANNPQIFDFAPFYDVFDLSKQEVIMKVYDTNDTNTPHDLIIKNCKNLKFDYNALRALPTFNNVTLENCTFSIFNIRANHLPKLINSTCICTYSPVYNYLNTNFIVDNPKDAYNFFDNCDVSDLAYDIVDGKTFQSILLDMHDENYNSTNILLAYAWLWKGFNDCVKNTDKNNSLDGEFECKTFAKFVDYIQCDWSSEKQLKIVRDLLNSNKYDEDDILVVKDFLKNYVYSDFEEYRIPRAYCELFNYGVSGIVNESFEFDDFSNSDAGEMENEFFNADTNSFDEINFIELCAIIDKEFGECPSGNPFGDLYQAKDFLKFRNDIITIEHPEPYWTMEIGEENIETFEKIETYLKANHYHKKIESNLSNHAKFYYGDNDLTVELLDPSSFFRVFDSMKGFWDIDISANTKEIQFSNIDNINRIRGNCFSLILENCGVKDETFIECCYPTRISNTSGKHHCVFYWNMYGASNDLSNFFDHTDNLTTLTLNPRNGDREREEKFFFFDGPKLYDSLCNNANNDNPSKLFLDLFRYSHRALANLNEWPYLNVSQDKEIKKFEETRFFKEVIAPLNNKKPVNESFDFEGDFFENEEENDFYKANTDVFTADSLELARPSVESFLRYYTSQINKETGHNYMRFNQSDGKIYMQLIPRQYSIKNYGSYMRFEDDWKKIKQILSNYGYKDKIYVINNDNPYAASICLDSYVDYNKRYDIDLSSFFDLFDFSKNNNKTRVIVQADDCLKVNLTIKNGYMLDISAQLNTLKIENSIISGMVIGTINALPDIKNCEFTVDHFNTLICLPRTIDVDTNRVDIRQFFKSYETDNFDFELDCAETNLQNSPREFLEKYMLIVVCKLYDSFVSVKENDNASSLINEFMSLLEEEFRSIVESLADVMKHSNKEFKQTRFCQDFSDAYTL